ncbi:MAG: LamG domain-containing protein, partial [Pirellulales bacterium]
VVENRQRGSTHVFYNIAGAVVAGDPLYLEEAELVLRGDTPSDQFGTLPTSPGVDVDMDGLDDLIVGAASADNVLANPLVDAGKVHFIYGKRRPGSLPDSDDVTPLANFSVSGSGDFLVDRATGQPALFDSQLAAGQAEKWFQFTTLGDGEPGDHVLLSPDARPTSTSSMLALAAGTIGAQPAVVPPPNSGLVSYFPFDGTTDDVASRFDQYSGFINDSLTPRGGTANFVPGRVGQALRMGVSAGDLTDLVAPAPSFDVQLPATYTIEMWVNPSDLTGTFQRLVLNWGGATGFAYHFAIRNEAGFNNAVSLFHGQANGSQPNANGGTVVLGQWQHLAGVADGSTLRVYLNGTQVGTAAYDGTIRNAFNEGLSVGDSSGSPGSIWSASPARSIASSS